MSLVTGLARLPVTRAASVPSVNVIQHPKLIPVVIAAVVAVIAVWAGISLSRWRRITWREHMDAPVSLVPKGASKNGTGTAWKVFARHQEVADPSLVLVRVKNSGFASISEADIRRPITFTFPGREVREFTVTDCRGVAREDIQSPSAVVTENRILLPRFAMSRRASFKLLVLLSGTGGGVHGKGYIRRGRIVRERGQELPGRPVRGARHRHAAAPDQHDSWHPRLRADLRRRHVSQRGAGEARRGGPRHRGGRERRVPVLDGRVPLHLRARRAQVTDRGLPQLRQHPHLPGHPAPRLLHPVRGP